MERDVIITKVLEKHAEQMKKLEAIQTQRMSYDKLLSIVKEGNYFLGITGLRGIGKTTLMLQLARALGGIYVAADDRNLRGENLYDIVQALKSAGHKNIFIDEIHAKPEWDRDLKSLYDEGAVYIAFTGSSSVKIKSLKADLSRRAVIEHLDPPSFGEWLYVKKGIVFPAMSLQQVIKKKNQLVKEYGHVYKYMSEYYANGGVLYEVGTDFYKTIISVLETIATKDLLSVRDLQDDTEENFFKLVYLIASSNPMELSYSKIGQVLEKNKVWVMRFLNDVEKTAVIKRVYSCGSGMKSARMEAKYYLPFPYRSALSLSLNKPPNIGSVREEFFISHVDCCYIRTDDKRTADFKVAGKSFEIGGPGKKNKQKADYLIVDSLDTTGNRVPLFLIGLASRAL